MTDTNDSALDGAGKVGHTPGPWSWMGNQHDLYLATTHSGRRYVMGFDRMGFRSAQPTFRAGNRILPAAELVEFEVGDRGVRGFKQGKIDESVYRYDVIGIDNPDARLIAAAPELLEALNDLVSVVEAAGVGNLSRGVQIGQVSWAVKANDCLDIAAAAIAKATGAAS